MASLIPSFILHYHYANMLLLNEKTPRAIVPNAVPISTNMSSVKSRMRSHYQIGYNDYVMWYQSLIHLIIKGVMLMDNPLFTEWWRQ